MANAMTGDGTSYADFTYSLELTSEEYGIACREGSDLTDAINDIMVELINDGSLAALAEKYELTLA
ncbi:MAG: transporter substrate-binding domain-containing protein, partial [Clostridia bacterium]|nr:transporter substrate-binding domain-containing protein [Clostridia bacterium]